MHACAKREKMQVEERYIFLLLRSSHKTQIMSIVPSNRPENLIHCYMVYIIHTQLLIHHVCTTHRWFCRIPPIHHLNWRQNCHWVGALPLDCTARTTQKLIPSFKRLYFHLVFRRERLHNSILLTSAGKSLHHHFIFNGSFWNFACTTTMTVRVMNKICRTFWLLT